MVSCRSSKQRCLSSLYVNGVQLGTTESIGAGDTQGLVKVGYRKDAGANNFDGYLSDYYFLDSRLFRPLHLGTSTPRAGTKGQREVLENIDN